MLPFIQFLISSRLWLAFEDYDDDELLCLWNPAVRPPPRTPPPGLNDFPSTFGFKSCVGFLFIPRWKGDISFTISLLWVSTI